MITRVYRGIDVVPFTLNKPIFIDIEALSSDDRFTRLNLLFGDKAKRDTNSAASTRIYKLNEVFSIRRVRDN